MLKRVHSILCGLAVAVLFVALNASAAPTGTTCTGALCQVDATGDLRTNPGAASESLEVEVCVTTITRNRTLAAAEYLVGAKALHTHNRSTATCYLTLDAVNLTTTGSTGYKYAADQERNFDLDGSNFGPLFGLNCTATTTTAACMFLGWLK
jgi:hypothetical protein